MIEFFAQKTMRPVEPTIRPDREDNLRHLSESGSDSESKSESNCPISSIIISLIALEIEQAQPKLSCRAALCGHKGRLLLKSFRDAHNNGKRAGANE